MKLTRPITSFLLPLLLAACATSGQVSPTPQEMNTTLKNLTEQNGRACIRVRDISGYASLSDSVISVSSNFRSQFLVITSFRCPAIESSMGALFEGSFSEFCGGGRDFVATSNGRCPILSIYEFDGRDAAFKTYDQAEELITAARAMAEAAQNEAND